MKCASCGMESWNDFCPYCGSKLKVEQSTAASTFEQNIPVPPPQQNLTVPAATGYGSMHAKKKKPIYKRFWFYLLSIIIIVVAICGFLNIKKLDNGVVINWNEMVLGSELPNPPSNMGKIIENSSEEMNVDINNISAKQFNDYIKACKDKGFTVDSKTDSTEYSSYNSEGYKLKLLRYESNNQLSIALNAPMEMSPITWPSSKAANQLPVPKSIFGKFSYENEDSFKVYIGNTSMEDYEKYVKACSDKGFTVDYSKKDDLYNAKNNSGWDLSLGYEGNNIMSISISAPDNESKDSDDDNKSDAKKDAAKAAPKQATPKAEPKPKTNTKLVNGLRSDFKAAMDSYETVMDEYVAFMKKYKKNPTDKTILNEYSAYLDKYNDAVKKFNNWHSKDLNSDELNYYVDVQARVSKKLIAVSQ
ncbi:DUF6591 domain-containing protein [Gardnerella leopoldii]|uniref:DUF6591 domain-containing protein n=1 Tax=Gardnerella TaxID=2701 RepID=UPI0039EF9A88